MHCIVIHGMLNKLKLKLKWSAFVISHSGGLTAPILIHLTYAWNEYTLTMHHTITINGFALEIGFTVPHIQSNPQYSIMKV